MGSNPSAYFDAMGNRLFASFDDWTGDGSAFLVINFGYNGKMPVSQCAKIATRISSFAEKNDVLHIQIGVYVYSNWENRSFDRFIAFCKAGGTTAIYVRFKP